MARKKTKHGSKAFIAKELFLGVLSIVSLFLVVFDYLGHPTSSQRHTVNQVDTIIACLFLTDLLISLALSKNKSHFLRHNWYFFLAAIPITDALTESLRGLRLLRVIRLVRASEHLDYTIARESNR